MAGFDVTTINGTYHNTSLDNQFGVQDQYLTCHIQRSTQMTTALVICIFGLLGNCAFVYAVARIPTLRSTLDALLVNLAFADSFYLLGNAMICICVLQDYMQCVFVSNLVANCSVIIFNAIALYASTFTILAISFERYFAVCKPLRHHSSGVTPQTKTAFYIAACWLFSLLITAVLVSVVECQRSTYFLWKKIFVELVSILVILVPMLLITMWYIAIIRELKKRSHSTENTKDSANKDDKQVVRMCAITAALTFFFHFPKWLLDVIELLEVEVDDVLNITLDFKVCLNNFSVYFLLLNSTVNIFIYNATSSRYRRAFLKAFCSNKKIMPSPTELTLTPSPNERNFMHHTLSVLR
ncbi:somatostatin receptor type 5-like [Saccoglossus kowalevskii]|uniref:Somatostatin receptor type 5-like n=1 Tax=Saccoglossus kowalevskii TaxID=10224 RepID=A0ABM0M5V0_SACKO|nr:PREDICTED: somatostatin receptor type 5-like [Saccoglossus kowalevskii]